MGVTPNSCISCVAQFQQLGNSEPCQHRTGDSIIKEIQRIRSQFPDADTWQFTCKAKESGLAGAEELCWEGLHVDICRIVCPDNLHGLHKFLYDHLMTWLTNTIGESELDRRFMAQPHIVGARNFDAGISHISQWSGKGHRDLERHIVPVIANAGGISPGIMKATRALLDFIYIAQFPLHSDMSLNALQADLSTFHNNKNAFIANGSRAGTSYRSHEHPQTPQLHPRTPSAPLNFPLGSHHLGLSHSYCYSVFSHSSLPHLRGI